MLKPGIVRFLLSFIVVLFHITKFVFLGHFSVFCFFMLSGYWISTMYDAKYKLTGNVYAVFYTSRIWRLFPVFLLLNAAALILYASYHPEFAQNINGLPLSDKVLFWLSNLFMLGFNLLKYQVLVPAWSLDIELQFYLLFPLIFAGMVRLKKGVYAATAILLGLSFFLSVFYNDAVVSKTLLYYLPYFLIGIIMYRKDFRFSRNTELVFNLLFMAAVLANYVAPALRQLTVHDVHSDYNRYLNQVLPLLLIPFLSNSVKQASPSFDRTLGNMSYVLYLAHWVFLIPYAYYTDGLSAKYKLIAAAVYLLVTIGLSYLIYQFYDKPLDALRRKWVNGRNAKPATEKRYMERRTAQQPLFSK